MSPAVVVDVPMKAEYGEESSNLKISKVVVIFYKHFRNLFKEFL